MLLPLSKLMRHKQCNAKLWLVVKSLRLPLAEGLKVCGLVALLAGCADQLERPILPSQPDKFLTLDSWQLAWFENSGDKPSQTLHVYIDGDGRPLSANVLTASEDPTPQNPLALKLAAMDPSAAIYLGRPCHFLVDQAACEPSLWTTARYSEVVVLALCQALEQLVGEPARPISLIGFSGGGALAVLVANCLDTAVNVVTINGNLSIDTWTQLRGFERLEQSQNPLDHGLPEYVSGRIYLVGLEDQLVSPAVSTEFAARFGGEVIAYRGYGHRCCWLDDWPTILGQLARQLDYW